MLKLILLTFLAFGNLNITYYDYITASGQYPNRLKSKELNENIINNSNKLIYKVNKLLNHLKIDKVIITSGFRPSKVNNNIKKSAKNSHHLKGNAIDIYDKDGKIGDILLKNKHLLEIYDLYLEHPDKTKYHVHLQQIEPFSKKRIFIP